MRETTKYLMLITLIFSCRIPLKNSKSGLRTDGALQNYQFRAEIKINEKMEFSLIPGLGTPHIVEVVPVLESKQTSSEKIPETGLALGDVRIKTFKAKVTKDEKSSTAIDCITQPMDLTASNSVTFDCTDALRDEPLKQTPASSPTPSTSDTSPEDFKPNQDPANQKYCVCHSEPVATTADGKVLSQGSKTVEYDQKVDKSLSCSTLDNKILSVSTSRRLSNCVDATIDNQKTCRCTQRNTKPADASLPLENQPFSVEGGDCSKLNKIYPDFVLYDCK